MSPTHESSFKLDQLAERAGVSARTVRYYVQRGLLPAPAFRGRDTVYTHEHLLRLRAIKRLQEQFLPLDAIQVEIERSSPEQLRELADGRPAIRGRTTADEQSAGGSDDEGYVVIPKREHPHIPSHPYRLPGVPIVTVPHGPERFARWELVPGLELSLSDEAGAEARALAEELRAFAQRRARGHGGR